MEDGEKRIKQEDCNEDNLGPGERNYRTNAARSLEMARIRISGRCS